MTATFSNRTSAGASDPKPGILSYDPWDPEFHEDPYPLYARLREEAPLHRTYAEGNAWVVTRYADCLGLMRDPRVGELEGFALQPAVSGRSSCTLAQRATEREREGRLLARTITPWTIQRLRPRIEALVDCLREALCERDSADLVPHLANPVAAVAVCELLDVPPGDRARLREWLPAMAAGVGAGSAAHRARDLSQAARRGFASYLAERVAADQRSPAGGLLTRLAARGGEVDLRPQDRVTIAIQLGLAGYLMTRGLLANTLLALLRDRDARYALQADPSLAGYVVEESLRWDPPLQLVVRIALRDFAWRGHWIETGESLWLLLASASRDPRSFLEPERFDPVRAGPPGLGSGSGGPFNIGTELGRMATEVVVGRLVRRGPRLMLAGEDLERAPSALLRMPGRLPVTLARD